MRNNVGGPDRPATGIIDLGLDRSPPPEPAGWSDRRLRRWSIRWRRPATAAIAMAATLVLLAPEATTPRSPLVLVAEQSAVSDLMIIDDVLFLEHHPGGSEPPVWSAHELPTGHYLWSTTERLISAGDRGTVVTSSPNPTGGTLNVDRATGEVRSTSRGSPVVGTGLSVQVKYGLNEFEEHPMESDRWARTIEIAVFDDSTGTVRWSERNDEGWRTDYGESGVVLLQRDGTVQVRDLATGRVRTTGALSQDGLDSLRVAGDTLVVTYQATGLTLRGHALDTLAPQWDVTLPTQGVVEMLQTGEYLQWSSSSSTTVVTFRDGRTYTAPGGRTGRPRLLDDAVVFVTGAGHVREVVERAHGQVLADLAGWRLVESPFGQPEQLGQPLLYHVTSQGTLLGRLDLSSGQVAHLGLHPAVLTSCKSFDGGLVCLSNGRMQLWRWR